VRKKGEKKKKKKKEKEREGERPKRNIFKKGKTSIYPYEVVTDLQF